MYAVKPRELGFKINLSHHIFLKKRIFNYGNNLLYFRISRTRFTSNNKNNKNKIHYGFEGLDITSHVHSPIENSHLLRNSQVQKYSLGLLMEAPCTADVHSFYRIYSFLCHCFRIIKGYLVPTKLCCWRPNLYLRWDTCTCAIIYTIFTIISVYLWFFSFIFCFILFCNSSEGPSSVLDFGWDFL